MPGSEVLEFTGKVARKQADLPRFLVVPATLVQAWGIDKTTTVDATINGIAVDRRTLKPWTQDWWFITITEKDCRKTGIDTGVRVGVTLWRTADELPAELAEVLRQDARAQARWQSLTRSQQRMLRDEVAAAKQSATRHRRARRALVGD